MPAAAEIIALILYLWNKAFSSLHNNPVIEGAFHGIQKRLQTYYKKYGNTNSQEHTHRIFTPFHLTPMCRARHPHVMV